MKLLYLLNILGPDPPPLPGFSDSPAPHVCGPCSTKERISAQSTSELVSRSISPHTPPTQTQLRRALSYQEAARRSCRLQNRPAVHLRCGSRGPRWAQRYRQRRPPRRQLLLLLHPLPRRQRSRHWSLQRGWSVIGSQHLTRCRPAKPSFRIVIGGHHRSGVSAAVPAAIAAFCYLPPNEYGKLIPAALWPIVTCT